MAGESSGKRNSNTQLLEELEALSNSLYQSHTSAAAATRRTASLALPRTSQLVPSLSSTNDGTANANANAAAAAARPSSRPRRRMSLSPWRSRPKLDNEDGDDDASNRRASETEKPTKERPKGTSSTAASEEKKGGIWNWKPIRALSHIGMQKLSCLFSVEVVTVQNLPPTMNGLRLSVCVRKKETKDGAVQTMPSRVSQGAADFEETLFLRCHVYCTQANNKLKFEARPFWIYAFAVDAEELDFGRSLVDLSALIQESIEKSHQGARVRSWDTSFGLSGKARGGELVLKLGFQIMEKDGGTSIYNPSSNKSSSKNLASSLSPSFARKQSKSSFSVPSPKLSSKKESAWTPSQGGIASAEEIDDLNLDEPDQNKPAKEELGAPPKPKSIDATATNNNIEQDLDLPDFEVVDRGVEFQDKEQEEEEEGEEEESVKSAGEKSAGSEVVVKEIDHVHVARLSELDSIAQQIKALESMMSESDDRKITSKHAESQRLDADEETVTREFLQMLEDEEISEYKLELGGDGYGSDGIRAHIPALNLEGTDDDDQSKTYLPDLGKNLGCVVQTKDGGYLAAMNPLDTETTRKETPKLAMQISRPFVLPESFQSMSGFEVFQAMASLGLEKLSSAIDQTLLKSMDDLMGKTAEQVAFEGIASAIIHGRNRSEVASSSAARAIAAAKVFAAAMNSGRKERVTTGIWNVSDGAVAADEILALAMQRIEAAAVEALKIQADMAEEEAPFDVSPLPNAPNSNPLSDSLPLNDWIAKKDSDNGDARTVILAVAIQLRDPMRRLEEVGGPMVALIYAEKEGEERFKVSSLHVGGVKGKGKGSGGRESQRQRLTAMQWLVAYGLGGNGKAKAKTKQALAAAAAAAAATTKGQDHLWSVSSRVLADMWLKSMRNPDVKFAM